MKPLPWLVYADDPARSARLEERTLRATADLHKLFDRLGSSGRYLVLESAIEYGYDFDLAQLPPGTVDARDGDAVGIALTDEHAVVVTTAGHMVPLFVAQDPRWLILEGLRRTRAVLQFDALSGWHHGIGVEDLNADEPDTWIGDPPRPGWARGR